MNAFGRWMQAAGLRNVDVARALGLATSWTWMWSRDGYWPHTREAALRIMRFTGGAVTPNDLLQADEAFGGGPERSLAIRAIRAAKARQEKRNDKEPQKDRQEKRNDKEPQKDRVAGAASD